MGDSVKIDFVEQFYLRYYQIYVIVELHFDEIHIYNHSNTIISIYNVIKYI